MGDLVPRRRLVPRVLPGSGCFHHGTALVFVTSPESSTFFGISVGSVPASGDFYVSSLDGRGDKSLC